MDEPEAPQERGAPPGASPEGLARREGSARGEGRALLVAALLLGALRAWRLGDWSLWLDEAYTLADAHHGGGNYNPLGYALVRWTAGVLGGEDEVGLRAFPALAGWLAIPLAAWALRPLCGARRAALVALLVALSPW